VLPCPLPPGRPFLLVPVGLLDLPLGSGLPPGPLSVVPLVLVVPLCRWVLVVLLLCLEPLFRELPPGTEAHLLDSEALCPAALPSPAAPDSVVLAALPLVPCPREESPLEWEEDNRIYM